MCRLLACCVFLVVCVWCWAWCALLRCLFADVSRLVCVLYTNFGTCTKLVGCARFGGVSPMHPGTMIGTLFGTKSGACWLLVVVVAVALLLNSCMSLALQWARAPPLSMERGLGASVLRRLQRGRLGVVASKKKVFTSMSSASVLPNGNGPCAGGVAAAAGSWCWSLTAVCAAV